jgi:hypothetical protein
MTGSKHSNSQDRAKDIEAPVPTIVGPRPEAGPGTSISVPHGMEKLLALAGLNEEWKVKTLADPVRTAAEADIPLSPSESAILKVIPPQTLGQMILSFVRTRLTPVRDTAIAAGTAAAALLAATDGLGGQAAREGIRPDIPQERAIPEAPVPVQIQWETSLEVALAQASASNRAVMVVCPYGAKTITRRAGPPGTLGITVELPTSRFLLELCREGNESVAAAIANAKLIAVKPPDAAGDYEGDSEERKAYVAMLVKYRVADKAPLVFILAPDGTGLRREHRTDERSVISAIEAVPVLLAEWIAKQTPPPEPAPPATRGHTTH